MVDSPSAAAKSVALVERIVSGDRSAEEQLVIEFGPRVYALVMVRARAPNDAQDLTQDTLLAVLQSLRRGQLKDASKLQAYVLGTARNVIKNFLRKAKPQSIDPSVLEAPQTYWPDWQSDHVERQELVNKALELLSPLDRQILALTLVRGLKSGEIAMQLGLGKDVVRQRKSRAVKRVREWIYKLSRKPVSNDYDK